jgi:hypothetical protein
VIKTKAKELYDNLITLYTGAGTFTNEQLDGYARNIITVAMQELHDVTVRKTLNEERERFVERWHKSDCWHPGMSLAEYLYLSPDEYAKWVENR